MSPGRKPRRSPASTAGRQRMMRLIDFSASAAAPAATARNVLPVPAGPMAKTMSFSWIACRYIFWARLRGVATRLTAGCNESSLKKSTRSMSGLSRRTRTPVETSDLFNGYPDPMSSCICASSFSTGATLSASPCTLISPPRAEMRTSKASSIMRRFSS